MSSSITSGSRGGGSELGGDADCAQSSDSCGADGAGEGAERAGDGVETAGRAFLPVPRPRWLAGDEPDWAGFLAATGVACVVRVIPLPESGTIGAGDSEEVEVLKALTFISRLAKTVAKWEGIDGDGGAATCIGARMPSARGTSGPGTAIGGLAVAVARSEKGGAAALGAEEMHASDDLAVGLGGEVVATELVKLDWAPQPKRGGANGWGEHGLAAEPRGVVGRLPPPVAPAST